jgi:hypothetical protein
MRAQSWALKTVSPRGLGGSNPSLSAKRTRVHTGDMVYGSSARAERRTPFIVRSAPRCKLYGKRGRDSMMTGCRMRRELTALLTLGLCCLSITACVSVDSERAAPVPAETAPPAPAREPLPPAAPATTPPAPTAAPAEAPRVPVAPAAQPSPSAPPAATTSSRSPAPTAAAPSARPAPAAPPPPPRTGAAPTPSEATPPRPAAPAAPATAAAPLDFSGLESRLRETKAIGVLTKLSVKNQADDLLERFRAYHRQQNGSHTLTELRRAYDMLLLKLLSLLQDGDPPLAKDIDSSRAAIWEILADPRKFIASNLMAGA